MYFNNLFYVSIIVRLISQSHDTDSFTYDVMYIFVTRSGLRMTIWRLKHVALQKLMYQGHKKVVEMKTV
jgi:hypothetical protein